MDLGEHLRALDFYFYLKKNGYTSAGKCINMETIVNVLISL